MLLTPRRCRARAEVAGDEPGAACDHQGEQEQAAAGLGHQDRPALQIQVAVERDLERADGERDDGGEGRDQFDRAQQRAAHIADEVLDRPLVVVQPFLAFGVATGGGAALQDRGALRRELLQQQLMTAPPADRGQQFQRGVDLFERGIVMAAEEFTRGQTQVEHVVARVLAHRLGGAGPQQLTLPLERRARREAVECDVDRLAGAFGRLPGSLWCLCG
ncbi:hypothetical protein [Nocardia puris]|uniref:hypothetical protein n=1 Tax=Nocardia puris TaxID=208602 RepID=UPI001E343247|nr:hypothetical protein [Nocardia puris]